MSSQGTANEVLLESAFRMSTALETKKTQKKLCEVRYYPKIKKNNKKITTTEKLSSKQNLILNSLKITSYLATVNLERNSHRADDRGHE